MRHQLTREHAALPNCIFFIEGCEAKQHDWIAVNAASSAVASIVRALATSRGIGVISVVRSAGRVGNDPFTIAGDTPGLAEKVLEMTRGTPLAGLLDSVGGPAITGMLAALRPGATIVSYGVLGAEAAVMSNAEMIYRNLTWKGFGIDRWLEGATDRRAVMADELWDAIRHGRLSLPVRARYALHDFGSAIADASSGSNAGKVLIEG